MNQSQAFIEAAEKTRTARALSAANRAAGLDASATANQDQQRTPYARNWLMSLGWLANGATVGYGQFKAHVTIDELARTRRRTAKPTADAAPAGLTFAQASAVPRKLTVTAPPTPLPLQVEAEASAPRLTLRTWLSALAGRRPPEPALPEPVAEISADRLARALRPRAQTRPKWTVPVKDASREPGTDALPI